MIKVVLVDDHAVMRMGICHAIRLVKDIKVIGECKKGEGAAAYIQSVAPDVVLLDILMPGKDGLTVLDEILLLNPKQKVVMLTTSSADENIYRSLARGAKGYLLKDRGCEELYKAIRTVAQGGRYVPDDVQSIFKQRQMRPDLTQREREALALMCEGLSNDKIAARMGVSHDCVKVHLTHVFDKLEVDGRIEAMAVAIRTGLVRTPTNFLNTPS